LVLRHFVATRFFIYISEISMTDKKCSEFSRREFFAAASGVTLAGFLGGEAIAADLPPLLETDSIAVSMGYKTDTTKVDAKKYPTHKPTQTCANCRFYQGTGDPGPCQIFAGKSVAAKGWCQVWAAK
jgi:hypothetical protein